MNEKEIFQVAVELSNLTQRQAYLASACGGNDALRARVEALLAAYAAAASDFLNVPVMEQTPSTFTGQQRTLDLPAAAGRMDAAARNDHNDDETDSAADLSFLQPPTKPGSLGRLGHYEILQVLGQGAFGIVFKAFDEKLHRQVAIKAMSPQLALTSPPRKRFLREARSVAALKHENIVQIYSVEEQPIPYLAMEFVDGQTLAQKLDNSGWLEVPEILHLGRQMAAGLAAAHDKGLIHRDIKPGNILLEAGAEQKVKITDFGLARAADDATMTRTGTIAGTPMYMAPEQAMGQTLDHRADLFSLGSVLYQMTCGRPPFRGANAMAVLKRVIDETPRPIRDILPQVPDWLCAIIEKLHAKNPDERYQTAKEVADVLVRCQNELQVNGKVTCVVAPPQATRASSHQPTSGVVTPDAAPPMVNRPSSKPASRQPLIFAAAAVVLIVGLTVFELTGIANFFRKPSSDHQPVASGDSRPQMQALTVETTSATGGHGSPADAPKPAIAPFDAEQAKKHQEEWGTFLKMPVEYTNSIGMEFRLIPPGEFTMGYADAEKDGGKDWAANPDEQPLHEVEITRPFLFSATEVSQQQFEETTGRNPSAFAAKGAQAEVVKGLDTGNLPVESVSWYDAIEFCNKLSEQQGLKPYYELAYPVRAKDGSIGIADVKELGGPGYRLPTEAEWEYACRAGTDTRYYFPFNYGTLPQYNTSANTAAERPHDVRDRKPNAFGLHDMHGNVFEWCGDWFGEYTQEAARDPKGTAEGTERVMRGGSYNYLIQYHRSAFRGRVQPGSRQNNVGFRVARTIETLGLPINVTADPDRRAAKWVLAVGGKVRVNDNAKDDIVDKAKLPSDTFRLTYVQLSGNAQVRDEDLVIFARCRDLAAIGLDNTGIGNDGVQSLANAKRLTHLYLQGTRINDEGLRHFAGCKDLLAIGLGSTGVTNGSIETICGFSKLQFLDVTKTEMTTTEIEKLSVALPKCKIVHDGGVIFPPLDNDSPAGAKSADDSATTRGDRK